MDNEVGVLIIAIGSPYYGESALMLACSLKYHGINNIALAYSDSAIATLTDEELAVFSKKVKCKEEFYHYGGVPNLIKIKMHIYELSPWEHTLYIDADSVISTLKDFNELLNSIKNYEFTGMNYGYANMKTLTHNNRGLFWSSLKSIRELHGITEGKLYQFNSSLLYFKKGKIAEKLFDKQQELFGKFCNHPDITKYRDGVPDEYFLNIASNLTQTFPHKIEFEPLFFYNFDTTTRSSQIFEKYWGITMATDNCPTKVLDMGNQWVRTSITKLGFPFSRKFILKDKASARLLFKTEEKLENINVY